MAKFREFDIGFSLFPFLSIILCLIGTLSLINVCLILSRQMTIEKELCLISEPVEKYVEIINKIEHINPKIDKMNNLIEQAITLRDRLEVLQLELNSLKNNYNDTANEKKVIELLERIEELRKSLKLKESEKENLLDRVNQQEKINNQRDPNEASQKEIIILPSSKGTYGKHDIRFFIECIGHEIIIYPELTRISADEIRLNNDLKKYIDKIKNEENSILVMMIRPNGVKSCNELETLIEDRDIRYGQIPLPSFGKIDFGKFTSPGQ